MQKYINGEPPRAWRDSITFRDQFFPFLKDNLNSSDNVLEVGCGNGRIIKVLNTYFENVDGIDPIQYETSVSSNIFKSSLESWSGLYDLIISLGVAYLYKDNPDEFFNEHERLSKKGSMVVIAGDPKDTSSVFTYFRDRARFCYEVCLPSYVYEVYLL